MRAAERGWKARRSKGVEILQARLLEKISWVVHGFSTRIGGESRLAGKPVLNLGFTDWDSRAAVLANRSLLLAALGAPKMSLMSLRQIHSDVAHVIPAPLPGSDIGDSHCGDAIATRQPGLLLAVQAADCVPILLADISHRAVAAVHAGWRGTLARIITKTLGRMRQEFGTRPEDVVAAVGPAIGRCCYEVGPEVAQQFAAQFAGAAEWFDGPFARLSEGEEPNPLPWLTMMPPGHQPDPERVNLDLRSANRWQLIDAGVLPKRIAVSALCTKCRADLFFSYRREGPGTGRLMGVIGIRPASRSR